MFRFAPGPLALAALALAAAPLASAAGQAGQQPPPEPDARHIVVIAPLDLDDLPVQTEGAPQLAARASSRIGSDAARFVRCTGLPKPRALRAILDNPPRHGKAQHALHRFIARHQGCYVDYPWPAPDAPAFGACNPQGAPSLYGAATGAAPLRICRAAYDRGVLYERVVEEYGGSIPLTRAETFDDAVRARFLRRQQEQDALRVPMDREYFGTVACMVQISPERGRRLLAAEPGSDAETAARRQLIGLGAPCVGYADEVKADPAQFRAYTAEALYAWLVAAAGKTTLVEG